MAKTVSDTFTLGMAWRSQHVSLGTCMQKAANGGGGIFKTAAAEILRAERRLMSTGEAACPKCRPRHPCQAHHAEGAGMVLTSRDFG